PHAAATVGQQNIVFAVFLINDHVYRLVAVAEFGDGRAFDSVTGLQLRYRQLHKRRAGIGRQNIVFAFNVVRYESLHGRIGLEFTVRAVINLHAGPFIGFGEREGKRAQVGRPLFVGQAGDDYAVFDKSQLGDGQATVLARRVRQDRLGERHVLQREF